MNLVGHPRHTDSKGNDLTNKDTLIESEQYESYHGSENTDPQSQTQQSFFQHSILDKPHEDPRYKDQKHFVSPYLNKELIDRLNDFHDTRVDNSKICENYCPIALSEMVHIEKKKLDEIMYRMNNYQVFLDNIKNNPPQISLEKSISEEKPIEENPIEPKPKINLQECSNRFIRPKSSLKDANEIFKQSEFLCKTPEQRPNKTHKVMMISGWGGNQGGNQDGSQGGNRNSLGNQPAQKRVISTMNLKKGILAPIKPMMRIKSQHELDEKAPEDAPTYFTEKQLFIIEHKMNDLAENFIKEEKRIKERQQEEKRKGVKRSSEKLGSWFVQTKPACQEDLLQKMKDEEAKHKLQEEQKKRNSMVGQWSTSIDENQRELIKENSRTEFEYTADTCPIPKKSGIKSQALDDLEKTVKQEAEINEMYEKSLDFNGNYKQFWCDYKDLEPEKIKWQGWRENQSSKWVIDNLYIDRNKMIKGSGFDTKNSQFYNIVGYIIEESSHFHDLDHLHQLVVFRLIYKDHVSCDYYGKIQHNHINKGPNLGINRTTNIFQSNISFSLSNEDNQLPGPKFQLELFLDEIPGECRANDVIYQVLSYKNKVWLKNVNGNIYGIGIGNWDTKVRGLHYFFLRGTYDKQTGIMKFMRYGYDCKDLTWHIGKAITETKYIGGAPFKFIVVHGSYQFANDQTKNGYWLFKTKIGGVIDAPKEYFFHFVKKIG